MDSNEVSKAVEDPSYAIQFDIFNPLDGLPRTRPRGVAQGTDGRIRFTISDGLAWIDPSTITRNIISPAVNIRSISADERSYRPSSDLTFPSLTQTLRIDYTALSLAIPERVQFKYKLEGIDRKFQDAQNTPRSFLHKSRSGTVPVSRDRMQRRRCLEQRWRGAGLQNRSGSVRDRPSLRKRSLAAHRG